MYICIVCFCLCDVYVFWYVKRRLKKKKKIRPTFRIFFYVTPIKQFFQTLVSSPSTYDDYKTKHKNKKDMFLVVINENQKGQRKLIHLQDYFIKKAIQVTLDLNILVVESNSSYWVPKVGQCLIKTIVCGGKMCFESMQYQAGFIPQNQLFIMLASCFFIVTEGHLLDLTIIHSMCK